MTLEEAVEKADYIVVKHRRDFRTRHVVEWDEVEAIECLVRAGEALLALKEEKREFEEELRQALVAEWKFMTQHLDNWSSAVDARIDHALTRQWDNGIKSRRNP